MPIFSQSRDFLTKNGIITEGTGEVTSSTGNTNAIQSAGGIAAAKNIIVGTTATVYGPLIVNNSATLGNTFVTSITATSTSGFVDLYVRDITASGIIFGTITGNINTATNLANGLAGQLPYQTNPGQTAFVTRGATGTILTSNFAGAPSYNDYLTLANVTNASSTQTGALQVRGGAGVGLNLYVGGDLSVSGGDIITDATTFNLLNANATTINFGGAATSLTIGNTTGETTVRNKFTVSNITNAASTVTAALVVSGGVGIGRDLVVGGTIYGTISGIITTATFAQSAQTATNIAGGSVGSIPIQTAAGLTAHIPLGAVGYVLTAAASTASWQSLAGLSAGRATTSTHLDLGSAGQVPFQTGVGLTGFTGPGLDGEILVSRGAVSSGPVFQNTLTLNSTIAASSTQTGALQVRGGVGIAQNLYVGANANVGGTVIVNSTASSTGTGNSNALYVVGGAYIDKTLVVKDQARFEGAVIFAGTATYAYSTVTVFTDNLLSVHAPSGTTPPDHTWTLDDGKDIGLLFHYYKSAADKDAFLGFKNNSGFLEWYDNGTESGGVFTGTSYGTFRTGGIRLVGGNANTENTTSGDLQVLGGVGIGGKIYVGNSGTFAGDILPASNGTVNLGSPTRRFGTLYVTSSTLDVGGLVIASDGTYITLPAGKITTSTASASTITGAFVVVGGVGIGGATNIGGVVKVLDTTNATSTTTGALQVSGGASISNNLYVAGNNYVSGASSLGTTATGVVVRGFVSNNSEYATYTSNPITTTVQTVLDTFSTSSFRTCKYVIQMVDGTSTHIQELLMFHNGSQVFKTEYGLVVNNSELGTFDAEVTTGTVRLLFTANPTPSNLVVKLIRLAITG